jgi:hypothetical protein
MMTPAALRATMAKMPGSGTGCVDAVPARAAPLVNKVTVERKAKKTLINFFLPIV